MLWNFWDEIDKGESDQVGASYQNQGQSSNEPISDKQASNGPGRSEEAVHGMLLGHLNQSLINAVAVKFLKNFCKIWTENGDVLNNDDFNHPSPSTSGLVQRERAGKLTLNDLRQYLRLPIEYAARRLNLCSTVVKKYGMNRWLHREV
ncbi:hypothetical protein POTOM_057038 [Populus tomentosa]|uniref:RWP-RK domain-containing protein n=1 Tax=Populus tomentosa TaxID=118781 RepID=A0A8X7XVR9_POPTO|nr:hypothetical protein POTOM_057038 [Populus tomentosa]